MTSTYGKINNLKTSCHGCNSVRFINMAVASDNLEFAGIYLALAAINLAIVSHNMAVGPINLAIEQKSHFFPKQTNCRKPWLLLVTFCVLLVNFEDLLVTFIHLLVNFLTLLVKPVPQP